MTKHFRNILLPIDLDQESSWQEALPVAIDLAHDSGAKLRVITVVPDTDWILGFPDAGREFYDRIAAEDRGSP